jgi:hypothetical protein
MIASRRGFLAGVGSILAAPAIVRADSLMKLHHIPERYATVWGVGHDLEVVEHVIWTPKEALNFARFGRNGIDKFLEVTDVVYTKPQAPLTPMYRPKDWQQRKTAAQEWFVKERKAIVDEATGFTNVAGYWELREWQASQRPDLEPPGSMDWAYESIRMEVLTEPTQGRWFGVRSV